MKTNLTPINYNKTGKQRFLVAGVGLIIIALILLFFSIFNSRVLIPATSGSVVLGERVDFVIVESGAATEEMILHEISNKLFLWILPIVVVLFLYQVILLAGIKTKLSVNQNSKIMNHGGIINERRR